MAEPPHKRARRPDSKQMWDEADRAADRRAPAPLPSRERERDDRRDDRDRDRNRRYRSRSPRDSRGGRDRDRGERERDPRGGGRGEGRRDRERDGGRGRDDRDKLRERNRSRDRDRERDRPREAAKRDRERERDRDTRSRSPRKERERDEKRYEDKAAEKPKTLIPEEDFTKERTATPPVSFKVGGAQDHDRMEIEPETQPTGKKGNVKVKKDKVEEDPEDDDEIIIEDDGMAAMQAMMGFGNFGTTHQKKVEGNDISAVRKEKKTEYRQYMNRVGGFNRPLSPTRE